MSLSQWQLNGSCLPLLCSSCLHLEVHSAGKSEKLTYVGKYMLCCMWPISPFQCEVADTTWNLRVGALSEMTVSGLRF